MPSELLQQIPDATSERMPTTHRRSVRFDGRVLSGRVARREVQECCVADVRKSKEITRRMPIGSA